MNKYIQILIYGIEEFYQYDARELFCGKPIDERTMVGCIYRYMWHKIKSENIDCDIDIEYDRMRGRNGEFVKKSIDLANQCGTDSCRQCCLLLIKNQTGKRKKRKDGLFTIRPDIILHKRNSPSGTDNYMVVEFKKYPVCNEDAEYDRAKIRWNTCMESLLKYEYGIFVELSQKEARIEQCDSQGSFKLVGQVNESGFYGNSYDFEC